MADDSHEKVKALLAKHEEAVAELHEHLRAVAGADKQKLEKVLEAHKATHEKFAGDCEACWLST